MGRVAILGDLTKKLFRIKEGATGAIHITNETDGIVLLKADASTITDASGIQLSTHASRHAYYAADPIAFDDLRYAQIKVIFGNESTVSVAGAGTYTIPEGVYYIMCGENTKVQVYIAGAWRDLTGQGALALIFSDGTNVRLSNAAADAENSILKPVA